MIYLELFYSFFKIGILGFGGGYAILPLIKTIIIDNNGWLTQSEFIDLITISQITPGPILINSSTFIGSKIAGIPGAICATIASVTPSLIIIILLSMLYFKYKNLSVVQTMLKILKPAVVGLIAAASVSIILSALFVDSQFNINHLDFIGLILAIASFISIRYKKMNPIHVIALSGIIGMIVY